MEKIFESTIVKIADIRPLAPKGESVGLVIEATTPDANSITGFLDYRMAQLDEAVLNAVLQSKASAFVPDAGIRMRFDVGSYIHIRYYPYVEKDIVFGRDGNPVKSGTAVLKHKSRSGINIVDITKSDKDSFDMLRKTLTHKETIESEKDATAKRLQKLLDNGQDDVARLMSGIDISNN